MKYLYKAFCILALYCGALLADDTNPPNQEKSLRPNATPILPLAAPINLPYQERPRDIVARRIDADDIHGKTLQLTGLPRPGQPSDKILVIDPDGQVIDSGTTIGSVGGGTSGNVPNTLVLRDGSGNFAANVITANLFIGNVSGNIIGNVSGAASENVLRAGDTMTGELRISDPTNPALILNNNTTTPTAVINGNGTTQAPALQLNNNPTATNSDFFLTIDASGNVTQSTLNIGALTSGTSTNIPNTLVLRDNQGSFAAQVISSQGLDVVHTSTFHDYIYTPFETVPPQNILYVHKGVLTAPNQFNSVKDAVDSITTGTGPTTPFVVKVGAGTFIEDTITMKPYVGIVGTAEKATFIRANSPAQDLIHAVDQSFLEHLTLTGATDPGMAAINFDGGELRLFDVTFGSNDILLKERATTRSSSVHLTISNLLDTAVTSTGFDVVSTTSFRCSMILDDFTWTPSIPMKPNMTLLNIRNPNARFHGENLTVHTGATPIAGTRFLEMFNGAGIHVNVAHVMGFDTTFSIPSAPTGPAVTLMSIIVENSNTDVLVADQRTVGLIGGEFTRSKLNINPDATGLSILITEPTNGGVTMVGPLYTGRNLDVSTNLSPAFNDGTNLGLMNNGLIYTTTSSLIVTVSAGSGYLMQTTAGVDNLKELDWQTTTTILRPNADNFVFMNNAGQAQVSLSEAPELYSIFMGKVRTSAVGALFVEAIHDEADHTATKLNDTFTEAFGPIYIRGSIVNNSGLSLSATAGEYVYGTHFFAPVGANPLTWQAYLGGTTNQFFTTQTAVDVQRFDLNGTLTPIPLGYYAKHLLYVIGGVDTLSGTSNETYALVYSQTVFSSLNAAAVGPVPIQPATWTGNIVPIRSLIVTTTFPGTGYIVETLDERPRPGFVPSSVAGVTIHGNLLGLGADDHLQYLPIAGYRAMTGTLQMNSNNITFVGAGPGNGLVDSVKVSAHAPRHLPNSGADPLTVAAPVTIGTINADGTADAFSRSDHVHAHGAQTDPTLHALATTIAAGFMSAADKQLLVNATPSNTPNTLVERDANGNFAAGTITAGLVGYVTGGVTGNVSGAASANVLKIGDTMSGQLRISDATDSALVLSKNTTAPTEVITGNGSTAAPALQLFGNPPAQNNNFFLMIDSSGNVTQSPASVSPLLNATSSDVPNTLVLRDNLGSFAATVVSANLSGNVTGNVVGNVLGNVTGAASANVLKVGDTMSGQLRISDATISALVLSKNTTAPTEVITGNSTTIAPALRLSGNPTAQNNNFFLMIDPSGNVTQSSINVSPLLNSTSSNIPNTLVLRDGSGSFAAQAITALQFIGTGASSGATAFFTGQSTTTSPALRLAGNPTMSLPTLSFDTTGYVLTMDLTGNVMQSVGNNGDTLRTFFSKPNWYQWTEPRLELSFFDDFTNSTATGVILNGDTNWAVVVSGGGAAIGTPPALTANRDYGVVQPTLSANGSFVVISKNPTLLAFGQGTMFAEARVSYAILGTAAQQYVSRVGFGNSVTATDFTNGIYFEYANGTSGDVWRCRTINGGVATTTVTTTPVVAATYNNLRIEVNSAGTSVNFFIDGTLVATHTTNIPTAVANASTPTIMITKTNGGTARTMNCDYFMYHYVFSSNRAN